MNTTITIKKELKSELDQIGKKTESYNDVIQRLVQEYQKAQQEAVQKHAENLLVLHDSNSKADQYHKKILEDVANGNSRSWEDIKREL